MSNNRASVIPDLEFPSPLSSPLPPPTPTMSIRIPAREAGLPTVVEDDTPTTPRQAGPLPSKRGEIGFAEPPTPVAPAASTSTLDLPARHPHERSASPGAAATTAAPNATSAPATTDTASTHTAGKRSLLACLVHHKLPRVAGVTAYTFTRLVLQLLLLGGTLAGWVLVAQHLSRTMATMQTSSSSDSADSAAAQTFGNTAPVFVHVAFGIAVLAQALLLERCVFLARAERWMAAHPGELPPSRVRGTGGGGDALAFAPWNRPAVPTYAAALAEAGIRGTGDVEDGLIGVPPPPAYGKTRGSIMVFAGFMSDTHRAQARLARSASRASTATDASRPASYMSHDSAWDERRDARRAQQLEETLGRLQEGGGHARSASQDSTRTVTGLPLPPPPMAQLPPPREDSLPKSN